MTMTNFLQNTGKMQVPTPVIVEPVNQLHVTITVCLYHRISYRPSRNGLVERHRTSYEARNGIRKKERHTEPRRFGFAHEMFQTKCRFHKQYESVLRQRWRPWRYVLIKALERTKLVNDFNKLILFFGGMFYSKSCRTVYDVLISCYFSVLW